MKPHSKLCRPSPGVFDPTKRDTMLDLTEKGRA